MDAIVRTVLSGRPATLRRLLREKPALAAKRFAADILVEEIPHWLYVDDTLLHLAAAGVRVAAAKALIEAGADVNAANRRGARPLHYACDPRPAQHGQWDPADQEQLIQMLSVNGADVDAADLSGVMPMQRAVRARSPSAVRALLWAGANALARAGKSGSTPLHLAVTSTGASGAAGAIDQQAEIVALLLKAGAKLTDKDARGQIAAGQIKSAPLRSALAKRGIKT